MDGLFASYRKKEKNECIGDCDQWNDAIFASIDSGFNWGYNELYDTVFVSTDSGFNWGYNELYESK